MSKVWNIPDEALTNVVDSLTAMAERGNVEAGRLLVKLHGQLEIANARRNVPAIARGDRCGVRADSSDVDASRT